MIIYNDKAEKILEVEVDDTSYRHRAIMGDNNVTLYYSLAEHVELPVGSYCEYQGETYTLMRPEAFKMKHSRCFDYTVTMEGSQAKAKMWKFRNPVDGRLSFSLTAKPHEHLQMFVDNMNRRDTGWEFGECISGAEVCISYNHAYCYEALAQMASELETEFEIVGKVVSLHKLEYNKNAPLALSYGRGNGFAPNVGRANYGDTAPTEILFVQGGTDNIDASKYGNAELLLPKLQTIAFDGTYFEDEEGFNAESARNYTTDELGYSIRRSDKELSSLAESSLDSTEVYPKRVGEVSGVVCVDEEKHFYDIIDDSIPAALDYSKHLISGETMTIIFQSGMLAGKEFEAIYHHEAIANADGTVRKAARRFEIVPQEIDGQTMPNKTYCPKAKEGTGSGDTYAVFHCTLPDAYICDNTTKSGAEWDLFRTGVRYLFDNEETKFTFTGELDGIWAKKNWLTVGGKIRLGGYILFSDERFQKTGALVRITGVKDYINKPFSPTLELSNETVGASFSTTMQELKSAEVAVEDNRRAAEQFTKRRFQDAKETMAMLEQSLLTNFTESITPIGVQTMQTIVGDESLQYKFLVDPEITFDSATKTLAAVSTVLVHMTLGITSLSSSHSDSERRTWVLPQYSSVPLTDAGKKYYFYAKVRKEDAYMDAMFYLSETAQAMDGTDGYYYLLVGILNSEYNGVRTFVPLYGYTEILPGRVTTEKVVSADGSSYFDLAGDRMKLGDALSYNANDDGQLLLRGTMVQSQSGATAPLGCYRGEYNSGHTYYNGDEVVYTYENVTSTYRYINAIAASGHAPTETAYWQVVAQGTKGADGTSVNVKATAYQHLATLAEWSADESKPLVLIDTDGTQYALLESYEREATPAGMVYKWVEHIATEGDAYIMKSADTSVDGCMYVATATGWQNVGKIKGEKGDTGAEGAKGQFTEYRYAVNGSTSVAPALDATALVPDGWNTYQPAVASLHYLWMTSAVKTGDGQALVEGVWSQPVRLTPSDGRGIASVTEYYAVSDSCSLAPTGGWSTDVPQTTLTERYLWNYEKVTYSDGSEKETQKAVIGTHGETGRGISGVKEMYLATDKSTGVTKQTAGWTDTVQTVTPEKPYLYNYEIVSYNDASTTETEVALIGHYGRDGEDGISAAPVYRGAYSDTATYYGNGGRVDIVSYDNAYYIARNDAPQGESGFIGIVPTDTSYWNAFGASFESVATSLLFAEFAYVENLGVRDLRTAESGKRVHISQTGNAMNIYDAEGAMAAAFSGDVLTEGDLFTGDDQTFTPTDYRESFSSGSALPKGEHLIKEIVCGTFTTNNAGVVQGGVTLFLEHYGICISSAPVNSILRLYVDDVLVDFIQLSGMKNTSEYFSISQPITKGTHTIKLKLHVYAPWYGDGTSFTVDASAKFGEWSTKTDVRMSRYFANGQAVGCNSSQYVETIIEEDKLLHKVKAGNTGIELKDGVLKICLGGIWYTAERDNKTQSLILKP